MIVETHDEQGFAELWWNNFYTYIYYNNNGNEKETLYEELAKANAKYRDFGELEFDTEQDYVMLMLKWI